MQAAAIPRLFCVQSFLHDVITVTVNSSTDTNSSVASAKMQPRYILAGWGHFARLRCTIALGWTGGGQAYDQSRATFRSGNWRCDFRFGGGGDSSGSGNPSRRVRAEHTAVRQDRRWSAALAS